MPPRRARKRFTGLRDFFAAVPTPVVLLLMTTVGLGGVGYRKLDDQTKSNRRDTVSYAVLTSVISEQDDRIDSLQVQVDALKRKVRALRWKGKPSRQRAWETDFEDPPGPMLEPARSGRPGWLKALFGWAY